MTPRRDPLKTLWTSLPEDSLLSPRTHRLLQNRRRPLIPLTPARRLISLICPNNMEDLYLSPSIPSPHPALPRRSLRHSNRPHPVRVPAEIMTLHLISTLSRGSERKKAHQFFVVLVGRTKKAAVGANRRALSTFFPLSPFS